MVGRKHEGHVTPLLPPHMCVTATGLALPHRSRVQVVMVKDRVELDMRGRCSAGQKACRAI